MYVCPECGREVPDDADFCYVCGCAKKKDLNPGLNMNFGAAPGTCVYCGGTVGDTDSFCEHCGKPINRIPPQMAQMMMFRPKMSKYGWVGIVLALIPGLFDIFGLGHLFFRKWSRAGMYFVISALFLYLNFFAELEGFMNTMVMISSIFLYIIQVMEVFALAFLSSMKIK